MHDSGLRAKEIFPSVDGHPSGLPCTLRVCVIHICADPEETGLDYAVCIKVVIGLTNLQPAEFLACAAIFRIEVVALFVDGLPAGSTLVVRQVIVGLVIRLYPAGLGCAGLFIKVEGGFADLYKSRNTFAGLFVEVVLLALYLAQPGQQYAF